MSVSVYSLARHAGTRVATLALVLCLGVVAPSMAQVAGTDLVRAFDGEALRDPTRPAGAVPAGQAAGESDNLQGAGGMADRQYRVSFIRAGGSQPVAVINGRPVRVGEEISGARVLAIEAGVVALDVDGERRTFRTWLGEEVRQPTSSGTTDTGTMNRERETDD